MGSIPLYYRGRELTLTKEDKMKTATTISSNMARVSNKFNEELNIDDDILVLTDSGTRLVTIVEIVDAKESIVKTKNFVASEKFDTCPNGHGKMEFVGVTGKKGKGRRYKCAECDAWATKNKNQWYYSE